MHSVAVPWVVVNALIVRCVGYRPCGGYAMCWLLASFQTVKQWKQTDWSLSFCKAPHSKTQPQPPTPTAEPTPPGAAPRGRVVLFASKGEVPAVYKALALNVARSGARYSFGWVAGGAAGEGFRGKAMQMLRVGQGVGFCVCGGGSLGVRLGLGMKGCGWVILEAFLICQARLTHQRQSIALFNFTNTLLTTPTTHPTHDSPHP